MGTSDASGLAIPAGGKNHVPIYANLGAIPVAVLDTAFESFLQRVMELAIPATERANQAVTTDMGVSGTAVKRTGHPSRKTNTVWLKPYLRF